MDIRELHDVLEYIRDVPPEERHYPVYGARGYRITRAKVRKVEKVEEALRKRNVIKDLDELLRCLELSIAAGYKRVFFMKHHWEARY